MKQPARGKGTRRAGGKAAAEPAPSSTRAHSQRREKLLSPLDRVRRAKRIAAARAKKRPDSWAAIGQREELSGRQCARIYDDYLTWERRRQDPDAVVRETLDSLESQMLDLDDAIAMARKLKNVNAWVGAIRLQMDAVAARWEVMRSAGMMPRSMAAYRQSQEATAIFEAFVRVLRDRKVPEEVIAELMGLVVEQADARALPAPAPAEGPREPVAA